MIDKSEVKTAVAAATHSLAEEPSFAWIKKSGLLERAYFLGLFCGLRGIASENDVGHILVRTITETMFPRSADDTFQSTQTGVLFDLVRRELFCNDIEHTALLTAIRRLADHVDALDHDWNLRLRHTRSLLKEASRSGQATEENALQRDRKRQEIHQLAEELEKFVRHFALVETDHKLWKCLQE